MTYSAGLGAPPGVNYGTAIRPATAEQIAAMNAAIVAFNYTDAATLTRMESALGNDDLSFAYALFSSNDLSPNTPDDPATRAAIALNAIRGVANQYAVQHGSFTVPGSTLIVATSDIVEGPVDLPDGTSYLIYRTPGTGNIPSAPGETITFWTRADFIPETGLNASIRPGFCYMAPGTGFWYSVGAAGGTCPPPPMGWSHGFGLMSAKAVSTIQLNSENGLPVPVFGGPVVAAAMAAESAPVYQPSVVAGASGGDVDTDPTALVPSHTDPSGSTEPHAAPVPPAPFTHLSPVVEVAPSSVSPTVLVLAAGVLLYLANRKGNG